MKAFTIVRKATAMMMVAAAATCLTACDDDDDDSEDIAEIFSLDSVKAVANSDGTIDIAGSVTTNKKLKKFTLTASDGTVYDLLEESETEKNKDEDGKTWTVELTGATLPVDIYTLDVRTRLGTTKTSTIGSEYEFTVGDGENEELGSYISLRDQTCYLLSDFTEGTGDDRVITDSSIAESIEILFYDTESPYIKSADEAKAGVVAAATAQAKVYSSSKTVITSTGCIATYSFSDIDSSTHTATFSGIVIDSEGILTIDVSAQGFTR